MKRNVMDVVIASMAALLCVFLAGCGDDIKTGQTALEDMAVTDKTVKALNISQPLPTFERSQERENLLRRLKEFNTADKISYIVLLTIDGKPVRYCVVKGKVSSTNSLVSNPDQIVRYYDRGSINYEKMQSPDLDGSYGNNPQGIFFYTPDGEYVEWPGLYLWSTRPLNFKTPPSVTISAN